ncbi:MAG: hypothetical protein ACI9WU_003534 [Myxococcota bacterium]|jgi:hypothetical protein
MQTTLFQTAAKSILFLAAILFAATATADDLYSTKVDGKLKVGEQGTVTLTITPGKGFKWNKDYPAKLTLENGEKVELSKLQYKKVKGEITGDDKAGKIAISGKGKSAGQATIKGQIKFSVCSPETCKLLKEDISIAVAVE